MDISRHVFWLFGLNAIDALITIVWIRTGLATEGNYLMAILLDMGEVPFLAFKLAMGIFAAAVLLHGSQYKLARFAVRLGLVVYCGVIVSHILTGFAVFGYLS